MEENERVSKKKIRAGDKFVELRDSGHPPVYVDSICESGQLNGTIHLSLGALINDTSNEMIIDVICRLRMNVATAALVHSFLGQVIEDVTKPKSQRDASKAN